MIDNNLRVMTLRDALLSAKDSLLNEKFYVSRGNIFRYIFSGNRIGYTYINNEYGEIENIIYAFDTGAHFVFAENKIKNYEYGITQSFDYTVCNVDEILEKCNGRMLSSIVKTLELKLGVKITD